MVDWMELNEIAYVVKSGKDMEGTMSAALASVERHGWAVFNIYDIRERLASKGFAHFPIKIIEICSARHANTVLTKNVLSSLCLPCKIAVLGGENGVEIAALLPTVVSMMIPGISKDDMKAAEQEMVAIVDGALSGR